jgi:CAAX protease family protein
MNVQHGIFDNALFVLLLAIPLIEWKWTWPRYLKRLATGAPGVRTSFYVSLMIGEWIPAACLLGWWATKARPWSGLLLWGTTSPLQIGIPRELRLWAGLTFAALLVGFLLAQRMAVLARPERMESVRPKLEFAEPLLPHNNAEHRLFWMVSLTAGVCEELFFRGFLIWYLMAWMGPLAAALLSSAIFGIGHIYLGWAQAPRTGLVGLVLAFVALGSASLFPAMLLHAAMDWNSGELAFRVIQGSGVGDQKSEI